MRLEGLHRPLAGPQAGRTQLLHNRNRQQHLDPPRTEQPHQVKQQRAVSNRRQQPDTDMGCAASKSKSQSRHPRAAAGSSSSQQGALAGATGGPCTPKGRPDRDSPRRSSVQSEPDDSVDEPDEQQRATRLASGSPARKQPPAQDHRAQSPSHVVTSNLRARTPVHHRSASARTPPRAAPLRGSVAPCSETHEYDEYFGWFTKLAGVTADRASTPSRVTRGPRALAAASPRPSAEIGRDNGGRVAEVRVVHAQSCTWTPAGGAEGAGGCGGR